MEPNTAQMTIFYGGQVMVFNDMSAGKAMEIMRLATIASCQASGIPTPKESITKITPPVLGGKESISVSFNSF